MIRTSRFNIVSVVFGLVLGDVRSVLGDAVGAAVADGPDARRAQVRLQAQPLVALDDGQAVGVAPHFRPPTSSTIFWK